MAWCRPGLVFMLWCGLLACSETKVSDPLDAAFQLSRNIGSYRPEKPDVLGGVAEKYFELGNEARALEIMSEAMQSIEAARPEVAVEQLVSAAIRYHVFGKAAEAVNVLKQAVEMAGSIPAGPDRMDRFGDIATAYAHIGQPKNAIQLAGQIENEEKRGSVKADVAEIFASMGNSEQAESLARSISYSEMREHALARVAVRIAISGNTERFKAMEAELDRPSVLGQAMVAMVEALLRDDLADSARYFAGLIGSEEEKCQAFVQLARHALKNKQQATAVSFLSQSVRSARRIRFKNAAARHLVDIAGVYADAGEKEQAATILSKALHLTKVKDFTSYEASIQADIAVGYARMGQVGKAKELIDGSLEKVMSFDVRNENFLREIALRYTRTDQYDKALQIVEGFSNEGLKLDALHQIAVRYAEDGQYEQGIRLALKIPDLVPQSWSLLEITNVYLEGGKLDEAVRTARKINSPPVKQRALSIVVDALIGMGSVDQALEVAQTIEDGFFKAGAFFSVSRSYANLDRFDDAVAVASQCRDRVSQANALSEIGFQFLKKGAPFQVATRETLEDIVRSSE